MIKIKLYKLEHFNKKKWVSTNYYVQIDEEPVAYELYGRCTRLSIDPPYAMAIESLQTATWFEVLLLHNVSREQIKDLVLQTLELNRIREEERRKRKEEEERQERAQREAFRAWLESTCSSTTKDMVFYYNATNTSCNA